MEWFLSNIREGLKTVEEAIKKCLKLRYQPILKTIRKRFRPDFERKGFETI